PRDPLCALPGGRRLSRRDGLPDPVRRDSRHYRLPPPIRDARAFHKPSDAVRTGGGLCHGSRPLSDLAPFPQLFRIAEHTAFWLAGISAAQAQAAGWTFQPPPHVSFMLPWSANEISRYPWYTLP